MNILLTGANSYVGASLGKQLQDYRVTGTYNANPVPGLRKLDITNADEVNAFVGELKPRFIVHAAANAAAAWCEKNPELAYAINAQGTKNLVDAANSVGAGMILLSTYAIDDGGSVYGKTKAAAEEFAQETLAGYVILRPSFIVGVSPNVSNDRPFNRILQNIIDKRQGEYDGSWRFQPTWLKHLNEVVEGIIKQDVTNQTLPVAVPELTTTYDLAKDLDFGFGVARKDRPFQIPDFSAELKLAELGLPQYSYDEMITGVRKEIDDLLERSIKDAL